MSTLSPMCPGLYQVSKVWGTLLQSPEHWGRAHDAYDMPAGKLRLGASRSKTKRTIEHLQNPPCLSSERLGSCSLLLYQACLHSSVSSLPSLFLNLRCCLHQRRQSLERGGARGATLLHVEAKTVCPGLAWPVFTKLRCTNWRITL